jgi:hypothetical protein
MWPEQIAVMVMGAEVLGTDARKELGVGRPAPVFLSVAGHVYLG